MKKIFLSTTLFLTLLTTGCATGGGVGDYAMGDDSAALNTARNPQEAQVSRTQLAQHRRQRQNVSEELDLQDKKRRVKQAEISGTMGTVREAAGTAAGVAGAVWMIKSIF